MKSLSKICKGSLRRSFYYAILEEGGIPVAGRKPKPKVSNLYIAQTKDKCGLDKRLNYNLSKKDDPHVPECPKEKEDAIMDAFRHFGLI
jgi:hypothetical protein